MCRVTFKLPSDLFRRCFDNAVITLYREDVTGAYSKTVKRENVITLSADIQPYSGKLAREEYGLNVEGTLKVFCSDDENITEGLYADIEGVKYMVHYIERRAGGMMMIMGRCVS